MIAFLWGIAPIVLAIGGWILLQTVVLPKLGVGT